jgi:hypothetical protein
VLEGQKRLEEKQEDIEKKQGELGKLGDFSTAVKSKNAELEVIIILTIITITVTLSHRNRHSVTP